MEKRQISILSPIFKFRDSPIRKYLILLLILLSKPANPMRPEASVFA